MRGAFLRAGKVSIEPKMQACLQEAAKCERAHDGVPNGHGVGRDAEHRLHAWRKGAFRRAVSICRGMRRSTFSRTTDISLSNYSGDV